MQQLVYPPMPPIEQLALFHPGFALALMNGITCRPDTRILNAKFSSGAPASPLPASFNNQITSYSIFLTASYTIDPSGITPNSLKGLQDVTTEIVSGMTFKALVKGRGQEYWPISDVMPLQMVAPSLGSLSWIWAWDNPDNCAAEFTVNAQRPADNFQVWMTFTFAVLGPGGEQFTCLPLKEARARLRDLGIGPVPCAAAA